MAGDEDKKKAKANAAKAKIEENKMTAKALSVTYKAACKAADCKPQKKLVQALDQIIEEGLKVIDKIAFADYQLAGRGASAICDVLAGYGQCKNLAFWHCNIGDTGIEAICSLLKASTMPFSKASKLALLEITHDYDVPLMEPFPYMDAYLDANLDDEAGARRFTYAVEGTGGPVKTDPITAMHMMAANAPGSPLHPRGPKGPHPNELQSTCYPEGRLSLWGLERLGATLGRKTATLRVLVLDHNGIGDPGCHVLCKGLRACPSLQQLSLAYNNVGPAGAEHVAGLLYHSAAPQIKMLNMQGNVLMDDGLVHMGRAVGSSQHLKAINLAANRIGGMGRTDSVQAFCEGLTANASLVRVDLGFNQFTTEDAKEFIPVLALKGEIKSFRFASRIDRTVAAELFEIIKKRTSKKKKGGKGGKKKKK